MMFNLIPPQYRLAIGAAALLLALAGGITTFNVLQGQADARGYQRATLEWTLKYERREAELAQMTADAVRMQFVANAAAKAAEEAALEKYRTDLAAAQLLNIRLADEAARDPNHDNIALDAEAVDRHIRRNQ